MSDTKDIVLPCPFCGKQPYVSEFSNGWSADCDNDLCLVKPCVNEMFHKKEQVIEAWNTRKVR